jgi:hypothetical protein
MCTYGSALVLAWVVYDMVAGRRWTAILTLSALAHCFGLVFLCVQVQTTRSAAGISARALLLDGVAVALRLLSTLLYHGYLPNDKSGDYAYQIIDICALALVLYMLRATLVTYRGTYQDLDDDMNVVPLLLVAFFLGALLHGDMDDNPLFDSLWLAGLFVSVLTVIPQYWMIAKSSGQVQAYTAHYIAATAMDRLLSGIFMWKVRQYITCAPWFGDVEHTIWAILLAHLFHLVLLSDFAYYYARAIIAQCAKNTILPMGMSRSVAGEFQI